MLIGGRKLAELVADKEGIIPASSYLGESAVSLTLHIGEAFTAECPEKGSDIPRMTLHETVYPKLRPHFFNRTDPPVNTWSFQMGLRYWLQSDEWLKVPPTAAALIFPHPLIVTMGGLLSFGSVFPSLYKGRVTGCLFMPMNTVYVERGQPFAEVCFFEVKRS